jgi:hypothetical protein
MLQQCLYIGAYYHNVLYKLSRPKLTRHPTSNQENTLVLYAVRRSK